MKQERNIFAVCDLEVDYAYHFMEYMSRKKSIPFEIRVFTSPETFLEYAKEHRVEILLISEKAMCEEVQKQEIGQIMILSEGTALPELEQYPNIYKYQSSNQVVREALAHYEVQNISFPQSVALPRSESAVLAVYSPVGRSMKTSFALTLGQILAKEEAVLYLNMENYAGFEYLLPVQGEQNLGDLLYYVRQKKGNLALKLSGMVQTINNLDFVPPVLSAGDIQNTTAEEWILLLSEVMRFGNYQKIILDLGDGVAQLYEILQVCSRIYMPVRSDTMSQAKLNQFEAQLRIHEKTAILDKIIKLNLPYHRTVRKGAGYLEDLVWSELGNYVKELLQKEKRGEAVWEESITDS